MKRRGSNVKIGLLGGKMNSIDKYPFGCIKRKFKEETGVELPTIDMDCLQRFVFNNHTAIFVYASNVNIFSHIFWKHSMNEETTYFQFIDLDELKGMVGRNDSRIRKCALISFRLLFEYGL
jgi:hypothetical protein